ncbi:hypothetical protein Tco_0414659 [Tanacetum coccineum]
MWGVTAVLVNDEARSAGHGCSIMKPLCKILRGMGWRCDRKVNLLSRRWSETKVHASKKSGGFRHAFGSALSRHALLSLFEYGCAIIGKSSALKLFKFFVPSLYAVGEQQVDGSVEGLKCTGEIDSLFRRHVRGEMWRRDLNGEGELFVKRLLVTLGTRFFFKGGMLLRDGLKTIPNYRFAILLYVRYVNVLTGKMYIPIFLFFL